MNKEFEKLPEIKERLDGIYWNAELNIYQTEYPILFNAAGFINGAWYTYQEQQKKVDALKVEVEIRKQGASVMSWHREQILDMCESALRCSESIELNAVIGEIHELLK